jgi:transposase-like protein
VRQEQALRLRIDGRTYSEIARELGYANRASAYQLVIEALTDLAAKCPENASELRTLETERLTSVVADSDAILRNVDASDANKLRALELKIKASESLRKLWGLDAPTEVKLDGGIALQVVEEIVDAADAHRTAAPDAA